MHLQFLYCEGNIVSLPLVFQIWSVLFLNHETKITGSELCIFHSIFSHCNNHSQNLLSIGNVKQVKIRNQLQTQAMFLLDNDTFSMFSIHTCT